MAKLNKKYSFLNGLLTQREDGNFYIEEFNSKAESQGVFNLSDKLREFENVEGFKISFDNSEELEADA